ncbi:MAG: ATPase AAA [Planctomycetota bacterium]|nr:MAG: ATPase AAA [Planctomycetota bacterium]
MPTPPSKAVRLAQYLREVVLSKTTTIRDVEKYEQVQWFSQIPKVEGCTHSAEPEWPPRGEDAELSTWLEVHAQDLPTPPRPSKELCPWLKQKEYEQPRREPPKLQVKATIDDPDWNPADSDEPAKVTVRLEDRPGTEELYESYCTRWHQWGIDLGDRLRAQELYSKLYQIHRRLDREGETLQLCVAFGLLDWPKPGGKGARVRRHVVTATAELEFDPRLGAMRVTCPSEGTKVVLERDMLDHDLAPSQSQITDVEQVLEAIASDDAVWDRERLHEALQTWGRMLHPKTKWSSEVHATDGDESSPALSWAPALILRKRGSTASLRMYEKIIEQLTAAGESIPMGWASLVDVASDEVDRETTDPASEQYWPDEGTEVFFPLPANTQQREIVEAVRSRRGVVVQGPPGTGKSHTIANLMCHLLASGQRVLVTAENPRALAVLRDKLPDELKALCVSVLGQGGDAFEALSKTVREISNRRAQWSNAQSEAEIAALQRGLSEARTQLERADSELRDLRLGETTKHDPAAGYGGTPQRVAALVNEQRGDFDWLPVGHTEERAAPLSNREIGRWLKLVHSHDPAKEAGLDEKLPQLDDLPPSPEMQDLFATSTNRKRALEEYAKEVQAPGFNTLIQLPEQDLTELQSEFHQLRDSWDDFPATPWCQEAARASRTGEQAAWQVLLELTDEDLNNIRTLTEHLNARRVEIPDELPPAQVRDDAQAVLEHLKAGGKWKRALGFGTPKPIKGREYLIDRVRVDASAADEPEELEAVIHAMNRRLAIEHLLQQWSAHAMPEAGADIEMALVHARHWAENLRRSIALGTVDRELRKRIQARLDTTLNEDWMASREVNWLRVIDAARAAQEWRHAEHRVSTIAGSIEAAAQLHGSSPLISEVHEAIRRRDIPSYGRARASIGELWRRRELRDDRQKLDARMSEHAPELRLAVLESKDESAWTDRLALFEEAWSWSLADRWLRRFSEPGRIMVVERERTRADARVRSTLTELAAKMAWQKFFQRLKPEQDMALKSWLNTVKQMGKGKGRSAKLERLRRQARAHLEVCRDAIPVWVMPRYLVAEMVGVSPERFDTVIVDEASQMGLEGMFVFYIGRRTVIVGDDQQISPSDVGMKDSTIDDLQRQHIADFEHSNAMGLGGNVYANAQIRFSRLITLREHFRCMPEIIQFSNDLCYASQGTPLDPMRSYREDRLPPLVAKRVTNGVREGGNAAFNRIEAQEIVNHIEKCLDDERYDGKTFGVISLVGNHQAREIEALLVQRLEPETLEQRRILCGDAYTFQGDERHVIFLSMVASMGETRLLAQTSQSSVQRFNVAVSRAQDQLIVYHSVDPQDLKPECMRHRLLTHVRDPVRRMSRFEDHEFDSPFEKAVFECIAERGYRVETQVKVGRHATYRIDLVVHGVDSKLAVECDGDRWHGVEQFESDMARQRDLERVGWEFVRIAGSAFYRDRDEALAPLWEALAEREIHPASTDNRPVEPADSTSPALLGQPPTASSPPSVPELDETRDGSSQGIHDAQSTSLNFSNQDPQPSTDHPERVGGAETGPAALHPTEPLPDPRESTNVKAALLSLLTQCGPLPREYLMRRYARGANIGRVGRIVRESLGRVIQSATRSGEIVAVDEMELRGSDPILRVANSDPTRPRPIGDRAFEEVPPSEWAQVMLTLCGGYEGLAQTPREEIFRRALTHCGFTSLTQNRRPLLDRALQMAQRSD